jgi:hypothetical protein
MTYQITRVGKPQILRYICGGIVTNPDRNGDKQSAEIAAAIEWCSLSRGHQTGRLLMRLRDQLAEAAAREQVARAEGWQAGYTAACDASTDPYITADIEAMRDVVYPYYQGEHRDREAER